MLSPASLRTPPNHRPAPHRRRGSLTVEMLMVLVVLLLATIGVAQFGVFFANAQEVALAARVGGLEASQTANLPTAASAVPATIVAAIEHHLESSQIQWSHIRLEHNVAPGVGVVLDSDTGDGFAVNPKTNLAAPPFPNTRYVRLTVTAPLAELFPRALSFFGVQFFVANKSYEHTTVFRYELGTP
jgi:Flp pilus assembly protein TadG